MAHTGKGVYSQQYRFCRRISKAKFSRECKANIKKRYVTSKVKEVVDVKEEPENPEKIKEN